MSATDSLAGASVPAVDRSRSTPDAVAPTAAPAPETTPERCAERIFNEELTGYRSCVRPKGHRGQHHITQRLDECTPVALAAPAPESGAPVTALVDAAIAEGQARVRHPRSDTLVDAIWRCRTAHTALDTFVAALTERATRAETDAARWAFFRRFLSVEDDSEDGVQYLFIHDMDGPTIFAPGFDSTVESLVDSAIAALPSDPTTHTED